MTAALPLDIQYNQPRLHIALVTETWVPEINGVAHSVSQLIKVLIKRGHYVTLYRPKQIADKAGIPANIVQSEQLIRGFAIPKYNQLQFGLPAGHYLKKEFAKKRPDIVHIVTEGPLGLAALVAARLNNIPVSSGYHSAFHEFSAYFDLPHLVIPISYYLRFFHNRCQATCVPSQTTLDVLDNEGYKRLHLVGRGVDTQGFNPQYRSDTLRQSWGVADHTTVIGYVGRLSPEKRVDLVIQAYRQLQNQQSNRDVQLVIVGDGPDRKRLEGLAPDAIFAGMQTGEALATHYASMDVFAFASQAETFGNVVAEAMASGLPIIAFDYAAPAQLVTDQSGFLAPLDSDQQFIKYVAHLPPINQLAQYGKSACEGVQHFGWHHAADQFESMLFEACRQHTLTKGRSVHSSTLKLPS